MGSVRPATRALIVYNKKDFIKAVKSCIGKYDLHTLIYYKDSSCIYRFCCLGPSAYYDNQIKEVLSKIYRMKM